MKQRTLCQRNLAVNTIILLLIAAFQLRGQSAAPTAESTTTPAVATEESEADADAEPPPADTDAPAKIVSEAKPLPANIKPSGPVAEVIKLADSGLGEPVMLAYITNSARTFNLGADDIIYLNDIGVPGAVVTAMIQRDEVLKTSLAGAPAAPPGAAPNGTGQEPSVAMEANAPANGPGGPEPVEPPPAYATEAPLTPPEEDADGMFYDSLAPYGNWVDVAGYGRCWQPTVVVGNAGWQPYFDCGRWVYSECGWYWLSDYSWGWAPFHYGNWFRHGHLGWCWRPGRVWGPSWVSWRYNDHYCGWAPLPPGASFAVGTGLTFHGRHVRDGDDFGLRPGHYRFIAWDHFNDRELRSRGLPRNRSERVFATSTASTRITGDNQTIINNGLPVSRVAAATHRPVHTVALREARGPAVVSGRAERFETDSHTLTVFRPSPGVSSRLPGRSTTGSLRPSGHQPSAPSAPSAPRTVSGRRLSADTREEGLRMPRQGAPLVIRGAQSGATQETPPANSLVVIGKHNPERPATPTQPWSPAASGSAQGPNPVLNPRPGTPGNETVATRDRSVNRPATAPGTPRNWTGTVSSSPQPSWFTGSGANPRSNRPDTAVGASRPEARTYQPSARPAAEVPRYSPAPTPSYTPQRSYTAPPSSAPARSPSFQSRPAPSAPSAAPAPSAPSRGSSGSSNRNGR